jgi:DNA-binding LacI/PurR family transcriptional regulator
MGQLPHTLESLNRTPLSVQVADVIRKVLRQGRWRDHLPSERQLSEQFRVSRPTVRTALQILAREGLLAIQQGRRSRPLRVGKGGAPREKRLIGIITQEPSLNLERMTFEAISLLRVHLAEHGFATDFMFCPPSSVGAQVRAVEDFVRDNQVFCCLLISVNRDLQKWFASRATPALVLGSCHDGIALPSLDIDYRSVCRHAVGVFLGKGHRHLALVMRNSSYAGDLASEEGFCEGVKQHTGPDPARATIVRHNGSAANLTAKLDALFDSDTPPTALLVAPGRTAIPVTIYLLRRGLGEGAVSLIARGQDRLFEDVDPPISHYHFDGIAYEQRLSRLMLKLVSDGHLTPTPTLLLPTFFPGGTVSRRRS